MMSNLQTQISAQFFRIRTQSVWYVFLMTNLLPLALLVLGLRSLGSNQGGDPDAICKSAISLCNGYGIYVTSLILLIAYVIDWGRDYDLRTIQIFALKGVNPVFFVLSRYVIFLILGTVAWLLNRIVTASVMIGLGFGQTLGTDIFSTGFLWIEINAVTLAVGTCLAILTESAISASIMAVVYFFLLEVTLPGFFRFIGEAAHIPALGKISQFSTLSIATQLANAERPELERLLLLAYALVFLALAIFQFRRRELGRLR